MRRLLLVLAFLASPASLRAQRMLYVFTTPAVDTVLQGAYAQPTEVAFCVVRDSVYQVRQWQTSKDEPPEDSMIVVSRVVRAHWTRATKVGIDDIQCPGSTRAFIHTHPYTHHCTMSRTDWDTMALNGHRYGGVICGEGPTIAWHLLRDDPIAVSRR